MLQFEKHWIKSALIDGKQIPADLLDAPGDSIAVQRSEHIERLEDHQGQRSLQHIRYVKQEFQTEVSQLLQLIVHSLYSHPEIFLRELISNSSDALDKLRHLTLTDDIYKALPFDPRIDLELDEKRKTLTIADTGIGMNEEDLVSHLGTIARSGTKNFLAQLSGDAKKDSNLIGQFGVGFYSAFMVADKIEVVSRKAGEDKPGAGPATARPASTSSPRSREVAGTTVLSTSTKRASSTPTAGACRRSSRSTPTTSPSPSSSPTTRASGTPKKKKSIKTRTTEQVNAASALWRRSKSELTDDDYKELYKSITGDWQDPLFWFHTKAEGTLEYTTLFYIPAKAPLDLYQADYKVGVKLYVKRVFIMDDAKELLPQYLRFVRGIIDSEDLPLNVSREILQQNRVLTSIRTASVKKILSELKNIAANEPEKVPRSSSPSTTARSKKASTATTPTAKRCSTSSASSPPRSKASPRSPTPSRACSPARRALYYITGGAESLLRTSPLLEIYKKKDIEVLILDDDIDEIVFSGVDKYGDIDLKAVNKAATSEDLKDDSDAREGRGAQASARKIKATLGDRRQGGARLRRASPTAPPASSPTRTSPRPHAADDARHGPEGHPRAATHARDQPRSRDRQKAARRPHDSKVAEDAAWLLFDQALLLEGVPLKDPATFVQRLNRVLNAFSSALTGR
jgi:molecular chaperone HtpG